MKLAVVGTLKTFCLQDLVFDGSAKVSDMNDFFYRFHHVTELMILTNPIEDLVILLQNWNFYSLWKEKGFKNDLVKIKDSDPYSKSH